LRLEVLRLSLPRRPDRSALDELRLGIGFAARLLANTFTFTHPLNASLASDISSTYYWSKNLGSFNADGATVDGTRVDFVRGSPSGGMVTVTATATGTSIDKLFVKVGVTQN